MQASATPAEVASDDAKRDILAVSSSATYDDGKAAAGSGARDDEAPPGGANEGEGVYQHEECPQGIWRSVRTCTVPSACHATQCIVFVGLMSLIVAVLVTALTRA